MRFCVIIPDRNDRPELTAFCLKQLERMTLKPDEIYHVNSPPPGPGFDLIERVQAGIQSAADDGIDLCFVFENDDNYPANYFERFFPYFEQYDLFGDEESTYYNLRNLSYKTFRHEHRSSLFTTGFKISALNHFEWPNPGKPFLDIELWKQGRHKRKKFINTGAVGIKTGLGLCGGKGHWMKFPSNDPELKHLAKLVDAKSLEFYRSLVGKLNGQTITV